MKTLVHTNIYVYLDLYIQYIRIYRYRYTVYLHTNYASVFQLKSILWLMKCSQYKQDVLFSPASILKQARDIDQAFFHAALLSFHLLCVTISLTFPPVHLCNMQGRQTEQGNAEIPVLTVYIRKCLKTFK